MNLNNPQRKTPEGAERGNKNIISNNTLYTHFTPYQTSRGGYFTALNGHEEFFDLDELAVCEQCGAVKPKIYFFEYGGQHRRNIGTCRSCYYSKFEDGPMLYTESEKKIF